MRNAVGLVVVGAAVWLLAATQAWGGKVNGSSGICPFGYDSTFNANGVGCTFCFNPDQNECNVDCRSSTCMCPPETLDECCAETPCCSNCPNGGSLECNVITCECTPESCCQTICPVAPSPVLGSPLSPMFGLVAAALASAGAFLLVQQRRRRQLRQIQV